MNNIETKTFLETRLRNLKRRNAKIAQHAELTDQYLENQTKIHDIEEQLKNL